MVQFVIIGIYISIIDRRVCPHNLVFITGFFNPAYLSANNDSIGRQYLHVRLRIHRLD